MADSILELIQSPTAEPITLTGFTGEEYLSSPYYLSVQGYVADVESVDINTLLNQPMSFRVNAGGASRVLHGVVAFGKSTWFTNPDEPNLTLLLRPWLYFLNQRKDSRIFAVSKPQTIPDIVNAVFTNAGYTDYRFELNRTYPALNLCVQYQETDFNFVSRLLEQVGIYYYFTHCEDKHTLVLSDAPHPTLDTTFSLPYADATHISSHITTWQHNVGFSLATLKAQGYDMTQPNTLISASAKYDSYTSDLPEAFLQQCFQYPVQSQYHANDELREALNRKLHGESLRVNFAKGSSNEVRLGAGNLFSLQGHPNTSQNDDYYIAAIAHTVTSTPSENNVSTLTYQNTFRAFKTRESFVPQGRYCADVTAPRDSILPISLAPQLPVTTPIIRGVSLATVVGPKDTPIYTDQYGRIKLQFDWDNHSKNDENSFAWVRVKQALSSERFGLHFTPRVGQTVLVSFEQGDPNQPTVIGVMPSESNSPPFSPEKTASQTGFQTRSLDPAATQQAIAGHQLMFDDNPKQPSINVHAYKDLNIVTNNNHNLNVQGTTTTTVQNGNYVQQVGGKLIINANNAVHLINGNSRISITPTDIILEADKIVMGAPQGAAAMPAITPLPEIIPATPTPSTVPTPATSAPPQKEVQCNQTPAPAPQSILGTCAYYQFRYDDFVKRHQGCSHAATPPDYYLNYGLKYCEKFSTELYPQLSPVGKIWLPKAKLLLQKYMETGLQKANGEMNINYVNQANPIANELNDGEFKDFAFNTHVQAYWDAGFKNLLVSDIEKIKKMLDWSEYFDKDTWETMLPLGTAYAKNYLDQRTSDPQLKTMLYGVCTKISGKNHEICLPTE